jgi:hypothetical protein
MGEDGVNWRVEGFSQFLNADGDEGRSAVQRAKATALNPMRAHRKPYCSGASTGSPEACPFVDRHSLPNGFASGQSRNPMIRLRRRKQNKAAWWKLQSSTSVRPVRHVHAACSALDEIYIIDAPAAVRAETTPKITGIINEQKRQHGARWFWNAGIILFHALPPITTSCAQPRLIQPSSTAMTSGLGLILLSARIC